MRSVASILIAGLASLITFSVMWSTLVVPHHSYGGDSRLSQIGGTILFFGLTLFPVLLGALLLTMLSLEFAVIRRGKLRSPAKWRSAVWLGVCGLALGTMFVETDNLGFTAIATAFVASIVGAFVQHCVMVIAKNG